MKKLFKQFSFPGGIPSHVAPETPGSIHEGGELGLRPEPRLRGRVRQPGPDRRLRRRRRRGGDRAARHRLARQQVPQPGPRRLRAADPPPERLQDRQPLLPRPHPQGRAAEVLRGHGLQAVLRRGTRPGRRSTSSWPACSTPWSRRSSRSGPTPAPRASSKRPAWPMIVFRTPKGWTCPAEIDGKKCEDYWRSHQVPMGDMDKPEHIRILEQWMKSYRPEELFDAQGRLKPELAELAPKGHRRMSDNPHANGGLLLRDLKMPDFRDYAVKVPSPGATDGRVGPGDGQVPPRRHEAEPGQQELPPVQPRREQLEPLAGRARGDQPLLHGRDLSGRRQAQPGRPGDGGARASTSARAGWRAIC